MAAAADEHLLVQPPRAAAVLGHLAGPAERVRRDVAEAPALQWVVIEPFQHDVAALRPADEAADAPVERVDPGRSPGRDRRVVEAQRGAVEGPQPGGRLPRGRHLPHILHRAAAEDPPEVELAGHGGRAPVTIGPVPVDIPRANEAPEQVELLCLPGIRAGAGQHGSEIIGPAGGIVHAAQPTQPAAGRCGRPGRRAGGPISSAMAAPRSRRWLAAWPPARRPRWSPVTAGALARTRPRAGTRELSPGSRPGWRARSAR